jgi:hypothetical protein
MSQIMDENIFVANGDGLEVMWWVCGKIWDCGEFKKKTQIQTLVEKILDRDLSVVNLQ